MLPTFNPFWTGMEHGMEGYMAPYASSMPYMGYALDALGMPYRGFVPQYPFAADCMYTAVPPQR